MILHRDGDHLKRPSINYYFTGFSFYFYLWFRNVVQYYCTSFIHQAIYLKHEMPWGEKIWSGKGFYVEACYDLDIWQRKLVLQSHCTPLTNKQFLVKPKLDWAQERKNMDLELALRSHPLHLVSLRNVGLRGKKIRSKNCILIDFFILNKQYWSKFYTKWNTYINVK